MKHLLYLIALIFIFSTITQSLITESDRSFIAWTKQHRRTYANNAEFKHRLNIYKSNLAYIEDHNKQQLHEESPFYLEMNKFGDLTLEEFQQKYLMPKFDGIRSKRNREVEPYVHNSFDDLEDNVDWRLKNAVTSVKNEGHCGACWAHSTCASIEGQWAIKKGVLQSLSPQQLIDCSQHYGNNGCNGGLIDPSYQYIIDNGGVDTEESYPYVGQTMQCVFKNSTIGATITGFRDIQAGSESSLQSAVMNIGPISGAIDAAHQSFQFYKSGVYYEKACSSKYLDHGINIVGYGEQDGNQYYIVKNMWGTDWGMKGYALMSRNKGNNCGIATLNSYPIVD